MADVFCLTNPDGSLLAPSVQATVLAKYSRSPLSAREILKDLSVEDADKFQGKWVVGFGHNSVAELATIPICFEGVSIIASKYLESFPRAGYSEKSTRYQEFSSHSFVTPPGGPDTMKKYASKYYDAYQKLLAPVFRHCAIKMDKDPDDPKTLTNSVVKARAFDNLRYLLPAGTGTNLAAVVNMLDARRMVTGLRGHSNPEFKALGDHVCDAATSMAPSLMKHTEPDYYELRTKGLGHPKPCFDYNNPQPYVSLIQSVSKSVAQSQLVSLQRAVTEKYGMDWDQFSKHMDARPDHKNVPQIFRTLDLSFDVMMDYGAYRDLQRHRRCEQFSEPLHAGYGYVVPDDLVNTEFEPTYRETMDLAHSYDDESVIHDPDLMQYMIPLGYLHRTEFKMDMGELYYIAELRTKPQGHISYRRIAYEMYQRANENWPELMKWCRVIKPDTIGAHT